MRWRRLIGFASGLLFLAIWWRHGLPAAWESPVVRVPELTLEASPLSTRRGGGSVVSHVSISPHRLSNTLTSPEKLFGNQRAILLENAFIDTASPGQVCIPQEFRSAGDPGAYIVQSRGVLDSGFYGLLRRRGALTVSYIPNNALLVRADEQTARDLAQSSAVAAVLPYEPYYKIKSSLLSMVLGENVGGKVFGGVGVDSAGNPEKLQLNVLLFPETADAVTRGMADMPASVLSRSSSPFGPVLTVSCGREVVPSLARLSGVQLIELSRQPVPITDLGRVASGFATDSTVAENYLGLSGTNVTVCVLDTGIDATHPALAGRVQSLDPSSMVDSGGHGTHVAGIIAGTGAGSYELTNAPGSAQPPTASQFRGAATAAMLFSLPLEDASGRVPLEVSLQRAASVSNAFLVNSSWAYAGDHDYDLAAAICDAASRDALPGITGAQPLLYVCGAGNDGRGLSSGIGGLPGTVQSPATAKNVITVGAMEKNRWLTNETWTCGSDGCQTNLPWLSSTDSTNEVAAFSSRGNVGIGTEGKLGRCKPDLVAPGTFVISARSAQWDQAKYYSSAAALFPSTPDPNYIQVLSNLNESVGPHYRFESGTSLAAAQVSGAVALMQEFLSRAALSASPAGMKALLLNGARPVGSLGFGPTTSTNLQGWGQLHLPTSIPACLTNFTAAGSSMLFYDQSPASALATGETLTRCFDVRPAARSSPLRLTLVWTDPPANPLVAIKLVNDLDLVVTNLDTGQVYFGNDIPAGEIFNSPRTALMAPPPDSINNVESVFLPGSLGGRYSVTVIGRRVSANALSGSVTNLVQDYALAISSGDGEVTNALVPEESRRGAIPSPGVLVLTNEFPAGCGDEGFVLARERVGSGSPLLAANFIPLDAGALASPGTTNQWRFYAITNSSGFTNAAFVTFSPRAVGSDPHEAFVLEPDIDLYVSPNPALGGLDPAAIGAAAKSVQRGGTEWIVLSNAAPENFFIGVKCESSFGADYGLLALFSDTPFFEVGADGRVGIRGLGVPAAIPGPGVTSSLGLMPDVALTRSVIVSNTVIHAASHDLIGRLSHADRAVSLFNFSTNAGESFIFDDSGENQFPGSRVSDGPGSLDTFGGLPGQGVWLFTVQSTNQSGTNQEFSIVLDAQADLAAGLAVVVSPGARRTDYFSLPTGARNLLVMARFNVGDGPVACQLCPADFDPAQTATIVAAPGSEALLNVDATTVPPIRSGIYALHLQNLGTNAAEMNLLSTLSMDPAGVPVYEYSSDTATALADDAVSLSSLLVTNLEAIESVDVSVRIDHPRVSDLILSLVSPQGTRVLLQENRGAATAGGLGTKSFSTNETSLDWTGGPEPSTNIVDVGETSGTVEIDHDFFRLSDQMHVYYEDKLLFDTGMVNGAGTNFVTYGPGASTHLMIVMNPDGNLETNTAWFYRVVSTRVTQIPLTFTENTALGKVPIKFAPQPLTNINYVAPGSAGPGGIYYLPEQSLERFKGEPAFGCWRLEVEDTRVGPPASVAALVSWKLNVGLQRTFPLPAPLPPGYSLTNVVAPGQALWFAVDAPKWVSYASNRLLFASLPVNLLFSTNAPLAGGNPSSALPLLTGVTSGLAVLQTNSPPRFRPGERFYLCLQNPNAITVSFALRTDFDVNSVVLLQNGVSYSGTNRGPAAPLDYYEFVVSTNTGRAQFEIDQPSENLTLLVRRGLPLPTASSRDYVSANWWTNDEVIVIYDYSQPVPLSPGEWYIAVLNPSSNQATYSIMATEYPVYGTNLVITQEELSNDGFCLTWTSLPGARYYVQGKQTLVDAEWTTLSPTITASDWLSSFCLPASSPYVYCRVCEGLVLLPEPLLVSSVTWSPAGAMLQWSADPSSRFKVEWSGSLQPPSWIAFTNIISAPTGLFRFIDDGSQSGGLEPVRYYRLNSVQ